jgi:Zn-dependent protease with chaperone function
MPPSAPAIYFDGKTSERHAVTVELDPAALVVRSSDGRELARWPYQELEHLSSHDGVFRLGLAGSRDLARVEIRDPAFAAAIDELSTMVDRTGQTERRGRRKVVLWSIAAVISLVLVAVFGVPAIGTRLAPLVPFSVERKLGQAVDAHVRAMFGSKEAGKPFECGTLEHEAAGRAALERLVAKLEAAANLGMPLTVAVARAAEVNAIALPGGYIYIFRGLIAKSENVDEVAGVLAHEIGHVAHRDGTRAVLQAAGLSFLFGMVLGDFVGGGAVVIAARTILQLSHSREVERAADLYAVEVIAKAGGNPRALGAVLTRIAGSSDPNLKILLNHPVTRERVALIEQVSAASPGAAVPLLDAAEWAALKRICGER